MKLSSALIILTTVALSSISAGCATGDGEPQATGVDVFKDDARLGPQINSACFGSDIRSFRETRRNSVIIEGRGRKEYLVTARACFNLRDALSLGVDTRGGCLSRGDRLIVSDEFLPAHSRSPGDLESCMIDGIYEWNEKAAEPKTGSEAVTEN